MHIAAIQLWEGVVGAIVRSRHIAACSVQTSAQSSAGALICLFVLLSAAVISGCTANLSRTLASSSGTKTSSDSGAGTPNGSGDLLVLTRVLPSSVGGGNLDLVGDGSGSIGTYCGDISAPKCACGFSYIDSTGQSLVNTQAPTYIEGDLMRCSSAQVPTTVAYVNVKIVLSAYNDAGSNEVRIQQMTTSLDPVSEDTFVKAERYQCRHIETIPYLFDGSIYDPIQSDDPRISYPRNFYTTNFGETFSQFASTLAPNWSCPPNPGTSDLSAGIDLSVFSVKADTRGSIRIYPPDGSEFDRSTFYLAKEATGIFNVPVNAWIAPGLMTTSSGTYPPIGYGASPVPSGTGETCPDTATQIPPNFKWVKVWLFRKGFDKVQYPQSQEVLNTTAVACNPGQWDSTDSSTTIVKDCKGLNAYGVSGSLAARTIWSTTNVGSSGLCVKFSSLAETDACTSQLAPGCTSEDNSTQFPNYTMFPVGADIWEPAQIAGTCNSTAPDYPLHLCENSAATSKARGVPYDSSLSFKDLDSLENSFDFLFVVTPTTISTDTMNSTSSDDADVYTPYRFMPGDCNSPDPLNPLSPGDCAQNKRALYGLKLHDVGEPSDPASGTPGRGVVFPVCALQPI